MQAGLMRPREGGRAGGLCEVYGRAGAREVYGPDAGPKCPKRSGARREHGRECGRANTGVWVDREGQGAEEGV